MYKSSSPVFGGFWINPEPVIEDGHEVENIVLHDSIERIRRHSCRYR